jgi:glutathione synthase
MKKARMQFLFIMDPAESMLPDKDTTFALVRSAQARGHRCWHAGPADLACEGRRVSASVRSLSVSDTLPHVTLGEKESVDVARVDAVLVRKDPPFDTTYLHLTQQLDLVKDRTLVVNDPQALRDANEKLYALLFEKWMPRTLVTRDRQAILEFVRFVGGQAVLKPLDGAGGSGVVILRADDKNARALCDIVTQEGRVQAMVQQYQPGIAEGDKRVLLLDGQLLGAILRVPRPDEFRANIHVGGSVQATILTAEEQSLVADVGPQLAAKGLYFVGLDLIGGKLIEVNVTSPTGVQELGRLSNTRPEDAVIEWLEERVRRKKVGVSA